MSHKLFQYVPGLAALHRMPFSLRYKGTDEQKRYASYVQWSLSKQRKRI